MQLPPGKSRAKNTHRNQGSRRAEALQLFVVRGKLNSVLYESKDRVIGTAYLRCAGCGAEFQLAVPRFCPVCDKLTAEDYQPLDTIRSAHRMQRKSLIPERKEQEDLFEQKKNQVAETAWACVVYSMVPYLGMIFIPLAVITGGLGYAISIKQPHLGGRRLAVICVSLSFLIFGIQLILWWLLYLIPELNAQQLIDPSK